MVSRRVFVLGLVAIVAAAAFVGCSSTSTSPTSPDVETNRVSGTVRSDTDEPLAGITIWLVGDEVESTYQTTTDQYGSYLIQDVDMRSEESTQTSYVCYVNRTPTRTDAVNVDYAAWHQTVTVYATGTSTWDWELEYVGDSNPDSYVDD